MARGLLFGAWASLLAAPLLVACGDAAPPAAEGESEASTGPAEPVTSADASSGAPATACPPEEVRACYEGPFGTADIGRCRSGQQTCAADGSGWSACEGEQGPAEAEDCQTPEDDDCDGSTACHPAVEWSRSVPGYVPRLAGTPAGGVVVAGLDDSQLDGMFVLSVDAAGEDQWIHISAGFDADPLALHVGPEGDVTVVGYYGGTPDFGGGSVPPATELDAFAVRYAADGTHRWSHTFEPTAYYGVTVHEGWTYVLGEDIHVEHDGTQLDGTIFVAALDPDGQLAWVTTGSNAYLMHTGVSLGVTGSGELVVTMVLSAIGGAQLGGVPIDLSTTGPLVSWIDLEDGHVLHQRVVDGPPLLGAGRSVSLGRPDGATVVAEVRRAESYDVSTVMLADFGDDRQLRAVELIGKDVYLRTAHRLPNEDLLLGLSFYGALELGPLGVVRPRYLSSSAVAAVDPHADGRWVVPLVSYDDSVIDGTAITPDGAVYVSGQTSTGQLGGALVTGRFLLRLTP